MRLPVPPFGPIAFSPWLVAVASGSAMWFGDSGADSLVRFDLTSGQRRRIPLPFAAVAPSAELIAAAKAEAGPSCCPMSSD